MRWSVTRPWVCVSLFWFIQIFEGMKRTNLRVIISPDLLAPVGALDEAAAGRAAGLHLAGEFDVEETRAQDLECEAAVLGFLFNNESFERGRRSAPGADCVGLASRRLCRWVCVSGGRRIRFC